MLSLVCHARTLASLHVGPLLVMGIPATKSGPGVVVPRSVTLTQGATIFKTNCTLFLMHNIACNWEGGYNKDDRGLLLTPMPQIKWLRWSVEWCENRETNHHTRVGHREVPFHGSLFLHASSTASPNPWGYFPAEAAVKCRRVLKFWPPLLVLGPLPIVLRSWSMRADKC